MSGQDGESCDIMRHHVTSCDRERKRVGSGWHKMSFDRRRCRRETRWRESEAEGVPLTGALVEISFMVTTQNLKRDINFVLSSVDMVQAPHRE